MIEHFSDGGIYMNGIDEKRLRERVAQRLADGAAAEGSRPGPVPRELLAPRLDLDAQNLAKGDLAQANRRWNVNGGTPSRSARPGLSGGAITVAKRLIHRAIAWYVDRALQRQTDFNAAITRVANEYSQALMDLRKDANEISLKMQELEKMMDALTVQNARRDDMVLKLEETVTHVSMELGHLGKWAPDWIFRERDTFDYPGFLERFRGSESEIRSRLTKYTKEFDATFGTVLDLGCGRGEFLDLCREGGLHAEGVEINEEEVKLLHKRGLRVHHDDALHFLRSLPSDSVGGILCAQVIEHIPFSDTLGLLRESVRVLRRGGKIVLETINPQSLFVFSHALYVDPSHLRPIHPETLLYCAEEAGLRNVRIEYGAMVPAEESVKRIRTDDSSTQEIIDLLARDIYAAQEYAVIGQKASVER